MKTNYIYTLDWLKEQANTIAPFWDGKNETFIGGDGEIYSEEQAYAANELLEKIKEIEAILPELNLD